MTKNLKEKFLLTFDVLKENFDYPEDIEVEENKIICINTKDSNCLIGSPIECEHCGECKPEELITEKVDLYISNYEYAFYINFGRESQIPEKLWLFNVKDADDVKNVLLTINDQLTSYTKYKIEVYDKVEELETYAKNFFWELTKFFNIADETNQNYKNISEHLPLIFKFNTKINVVQDSTKHRYDFETGGEVWGDNDALLQPMFVYNIDRPIEELQMTVRHEMIHSFLHMVQLNHADNSAAFWIIATHFDAHPYVNLEGEALELFEAWDNLCKNSENEPVKRFVTIAAINSRNVDGFKKVICGVCDRVIEQNGNSVNNTNFVHLSDCKAS